MRLPWRKPPLPDEDGTRREAIEEALCRQAMQPGQFEELDAGASQRLRKRIRDQLAHYSLDFLAEAAGANPNAPTILLDEALNVSFAQRAQGPELRGIDALELEARMMQEANAQGLLFHGYDPDGLPIITSMDQLNTHMAVVGTSGTGKSTQLARYFAQLAMKGGPMILIDPHGTLIQDILPRLPAHRRKDVVYITPNDTKRNWGINLLQVGRKLRASKDAELDPETLENVLETTVQTIVQALAQIQEDESGLSAGVSIQSTLQMFALAAAEHPEATFVDVYQIATSRKIQDLVKDDIRNPIVRQYFEDTLPQLRVEYLERVRNKLQKFVSNSAMINMFSRRREGKDLKTLIDDDKIVLFDLDRKPGNLPYTVSNLIGFILVNMAMLCVDHRRPGPDGKLKPFYMLIDEFQNVASKSTVRWLTEARKQGASLIVAFQHLNQLTEEVRNALGNASTWCVFRSTPQDARYLAPMLGLGSAAKADLSELVEVPQFEMRLRYDEEDVQAETRPMKRSLVTVKAPPLPRAPVNAQAIVAAILDHSRRYTLPVEPADRETILGSTDMSTIDVLQSVFEAKLALSNPDYPWGTPKSNVAWAVENKRVTSALAQHILAAKGIAMTRDRFGGLKEALVRRRLISVQADQAGYDQIALTPRGLEEITRYVVPNRSSLEGGPDHKLGVNRLFKGLCRTAPMRITVPSQVTQQYTPDMLGEVPAEKAPPGFLNRVTDKGLVHFHLEEATLAKPERVLANLARAVKAGAFPVMVLHAEECDEAATKRTAAFFSRLQGVITNMGTYPIQEELRQEVARKPRRVFAVWLATRSARLYEHQDGRGLVEIGSTYQGIGRQATPLSPPVPAAAPPAPVVNPIQLAPAAKTPNEALVLFRAIINRAIHVKQGKVYRNNVVAELQGKGFAVATDQLDKWAIEEFQCRLDTHPMGVIYYLD